MSMVPSVRPRRGPSRSARRSAVAALLCAGALAGCAGDGPAASQGGGQFAAIQTNIFNVNCLSGGCHNAASRAGNLNLTAGVSYDQLVGHASDNPAAAQQGLLRVLPLEPDQSFLIIKCVGPAVGQGGRMPLNANPLSDADLQTIREWILDGAPRGDEATATQTDTPTESPTATAVPPTDTPTVPLPTVTGTVPATSTFTPTPTPTQTPTPSLTPTINADATLANIQQMIFTPKCAVAICHDSVSRQGSLVLEAGMAHDQLVGVLAFNVAAHDAGMVRVAAGDPDASFLLLKLDDPSIEFGSPMPLVGDRLSAAEIQLIHDWIAQGAEP